MDPGGQKDPRRRCKHANFVGDTLVPGEAEFLFTAYSVFTVHKVTWGKGGDMHHVELDAASDNKELLDTSGGTGGGQGGGGAAARWAAPAGSETLELAPWI